MASALPVLQQVIASQIRCAEELLEALDDEHCALIERDIERLETALPRKQRLSQTLQQLNDQLQKLRSTLRAEDALPTHADDWQQLRQLTERCDRANQFNGALVQAHEMRLRQAMTVLQPSRDVTYGRSGIAAVRFSGRLNHNG